MHSLRKIIFNRLGLEAHNIDLLVTSVYFGATGCLLVKCWVAGSTDN